MDVKLHAAQLFKVKPDNLFHFKDIVDPFNPCNSMTGFINQKDGPLGGSIIFTHCNGEPLSPLKILYGTPKLMYPNAKRSKDTFKNFKNDNRVAAMFFSNKWNGTNILFYKYSVGEKEFISAKSKGTPFIQNSNYGQFLDLTLEALSITNLSTEWNHSTLQNHPLLSPLIQHDFIQAISFELCGQKEPHLVNYSFAIALKPLFFIEKTKGAISPIALLPLSKPIQTHFTTLSNLEEINIEAENLGPFLFDQTKYESLCKTIQEHDFAKNEEYRKSNKLHQIRYEYNYFDREGRVVYLLNREGQLFDGKTMFKLKPKDIAEVHSENFDSQKEERIREAVKKVRERNKPMNMKSILEELDMGPKEYNKFKLDIEHFVQFKERPEEGLGEDSLEDPRCVIIVCGLPCSGKSQFCEQLLQQCNQAWQSNSEKFTNRRAPLMYLNPDTNTSLNTFTQLLLKIETEIVKTKTSVLIDRVNGSREDRKQLIQFALQEKVPKNQIFVVCMNDSLQECKARLLNNALEYAKQHKNKTVSGYQVSNLASKSALEQMLQHFETNFEIPSEKECNEIDKEMQFVTLSLEKKEKEEASKWKEWVDKLSNLIVEKRVRYVEQSNALHKKYSTHSAGEEEEENKEQEGGEE